MRSRQVNFIAAASLLVLASVTNAAGPSPRNGGKQASASFSECQDCPEMVPIRPGTFMMGASLEEEERFGASATVRGRSMPVHRVTIAKPFAMGKYPVTVGQFRAFVEESGYNAPDSCVTQYYNDGHYIYEQARGYSWRSPGYPQNDRHPVVCVSAEDAEAYAAWLSKKTGHNYSLPNEAQYEYSMRAGTTTSFFWGNERDARACEYSNQPDLDQARALNNAPSGPAYRFQCHDGYAYTSPVGAYKPNPWGLYDMFGNIWEWTADCWNDNHEGAPGDGSTRMTGDCDARPSRGGSFGNAAFSTYAGVRAPRHASYVGHSWGFRVVRND